MPPRPARFVQRPFAALAALVVLLAGAIVLVPAAPARAATHVVTNAQEFSEAIAWLVPGDVIEVRNDVVADEFVAHAPFTLSVVAGATFTTSNMWGPGLLKSGAGVMRVTGALNVNGVVAVQSGRLDAGSVASFGVQVHSGATLEASAITSTGDVAVAGALRTAALRVDLARAVSISGTVVAGRAAGDADAWNVSGLLDTTDMTLETRSTMTVTGELRLTGIFTNRGVITNDSRITGWASVTNDGIIRGSGWMEMVESVVGHNYRLELARPGATTVVRVLAPTLTEGRQRMPVPGTPDGVIFRAWNVGGAVVTGDTSLTALGFPVICPAQPALQCGRLIVASPTWDELSFTAPPQVDVPTTATFTGVEAPTLTVDGVARPGASLTPVAAEAGLPIRARVSVAYPSGYTLATGETELSTTIALGDLTAGTVRIVGDARVGQQVRAEASGFAPAPDRVEFEWSTPLGPLGTGDRIVVPASALGQPLTVTATAIAAGYVDEVVNSDAVVVTAVPTIAATPLPATGPQSPIPGLAGAAVLLSAGFALLLARRRLVSV